MKKITLTPKNKKFDLYCPFTSEKLDNDSFEVYEGSGNYIFSMCEDCLFFDAGNNEEIEKYWKSSAIEAIEKFAKNHPDENIVVIEMQYEEESYFYGFINEDNTELSDEEIVKRFMK